MKLLRCSICKTEREVEDNVILSICSICLNEMMEVENERNRNEWRKI